VGSRPAMMDVPCATPVSRLLPSRRTSRADPRRRRTAKKLPADQGKWEINLPEDDGTKSAKGRMFTVIITFTRTIDIGEFTSRLVCSPHSALLSSRRRISTLTLVPLLL